MGQQAAVVGSTTFGQCTCIALQRGGQLHARGNASNEGIEPVQRTNKPHQRCALGITALQVGRLMADDQAKRTIRQGQAGRGQDDLRPRHAQGERRTATFYRTHRDAFLPQPLHGVARLRARQLHCLQRVAAAQQDPQPAAGQRPANEGQHGPCDIDGQQQWRQPGHQGFGRRECRQLHGEQYAGAAVQRNRQCAGQLLQRCRLHRQQQCKQGGQHSTQSCPQPKARRRV
ncbi:hypothetical protein D3C73_1139680 [compost metagenome]